ncbi:MAG: hypothetical protein ABI702_15210 [Burkholderiales bacterium]
MADTLVRVGRMDVADGDGVIADLAQLDALLHLCLRHIHHENDFVHCAIEARRPTGARRTADDHREHFEHIAALRADAFEVRYATGPDRAAQARHLYAQLALFVANNLQHMHVEETVNNATLWALYSDAELLDIHERLRASIGSEEHMQVAHWMLQALNPAERAAILGEMKQKMPAEPFAALLGLARSQLDGNDWAKLAAALGVPQATPMCGPCIFI